MQYRVLKGFFPQGGTFHGPGVKTLDLSPDVERWAIDGGYIERMPEPMQAAPFNGMAQPPQHHGKRGKKSPKPGLMERVCQATRLS